MDRKVRCPRLSWDAGKRGNNEEEEEEEEEDEEEEEEKEEVGCRYLLLILITLSYERRSGPADSLPQSTGDFPSPRLLTTRHRTP